MAFNKAQVLVVLIVVVLGLGSIAALRGLTQQVIGNQLTIDKCRDYIKNQWCGDYACSDCKELTLPYSLNIGGTVTNKVFSADCVYGSASTGVGELGLARTYCQQASAITSHYGYWCYNNDLYYFNSAGAREELKQDCSNGCTSIYSGGSTKVSCNAPPSTTPPPSTCTNDAGCSSNGLAECKSTTSFRRCSLGSDGCTHWSSTVYCQSGLECNGGVCSPPATACTPETTCSGTNSVRTTDSDCTTTTTTCETGDVCVNGGCTTPTVIESQDLCANVVCADECTADYSLKSQGSCDALTGSCVYNQVSTMAPSCLPNGATGDVIDVPERAEKGWFEKWGIYVGGALIVALITIYIVMDKKEKRRKR